MSEDTFEPFGAWVQGNCYVKFRYSLFAGLPPFEWISRWEPTATAAQIESWFTDKLDTARADLANNRVFGITAESVVMHEAVVKCVYDYLQKDVRTRFTTANLAACCIALGSGSNVSPFSCDLTELGRDRPRRLLPRAERDHRLRGRLGVGEARRASATCCAVRVKCVASRGVATSSLALCISFIFRCLFRRKEANAFPVRATFPSACM